MYHLTKISVDGVVTESEQAECPELSQLTSVVEGNIESVPFWDKWEDRRAWVICNSEGKLDGLAMNVVATSLWITHLYPETIDDYLVGNILIISCDTLAEFREL